MARALLSVSDKTGLLAFAQGLRDLDWELVSTGGTARALRAGGIDAIDVSAVTKHPEMMDGRVKTLHPAIHAGLLARRDSSGDLTALAQLGYVPIDLVCVNLYPFHDAVAAGLPIPEAMEQVDIGGPAMLRAAAKNHASVLTVTDPADYPRVLGALRTGSVGDDLRRELAAKVFQMTSRYDAQIADYLARPAEHSLLGARLRIELQKIQDLRYGENPDQTAALYAEAGASGAWTRLRQWQGKELSFNNILDLDAALMAVSAWADSESTAAAIIKHTTPCGVALGGSAAHAYERALACDPVSAFGGIVAFNVPVDDAAAKTMADTFYEIVVAPGFLPGAIEVFQSRKNLRVIEIPVAVAPGLDYKRVSGGFLVQERMRMAFPEEGWTVPTERKPSATEWQDLRFAWRVCALVKSNAIVLARDQRTVGIGAGQMSRVDSARVAVMKAHDQRADLSSAVLASDAFFPFRDGVDAAALAGIKAVIQPGGSIRDNEVVAAANDHGIAMVFTGRRVFRH
jgi:phosphoribosylaminoimidazolecarboxamide formyltransferase/IMP cyclohydrolase